MRPKHIIRLSWKMFDFDWGWGLIMGIGKLVPSGTVWWGWGRLWGWGAAQGAPETDLQRACLWSLAGGGRQPELCVSLCCSWGSARPSSKDSMSGKKGHRLAQVKTPHNPLGLHLPHDEERKAEGGPQGQEANPVEEGVWRFCLKSGASKLVGCCIHSTSFDS